LNAITCQRGGRVLFQNVSVALQPGDVLHLSGANGTGKTSLLRLMAGALPAAIGQILWDGLDFLENGAAEHNRRFNFLPPDDRALKVLETPTETLAYWAAVYGIDNADAAVTKALAAMDMANIKTRAVKYLSAGQRRRLSLARVLLRPAPLWLLDEPFNGLDAASVTLFRAALDAHVGAGGMAVIASHLPVEPPATGALRRLDLGAHMKAGAA